nr:PA2779 family protein [Nitrospiraceae bacterium]
IGIAPRVDASFSPSALVQPPRFDRAQDLNKIQQALESKIVARRLAELGFTMQEINSRLSGLSDAQLHRIAQRLNTLKTGGDGVEVLVALLVIAVLVILILQMTGHRVIIR